MCDRWQDFQATGADLVAIGTGTPAQAGRFAEGQPVPLRVLTDPDRLAFRAIGARRGWMSALNPGTFWSALRARRKGFRQTATMGDPFQQGAVWIVGPGAEVIYRHTSAYAGDHPDPGELLAALERSPAA